MSLARRDLLKSATLGAAAVCVPSLAQAQNEGAGVAVLPAVKLPEPPVKRFLFSPKLGMVKGKIKNDEIKQAHKDNDRAKIYQDLCDKMSIVLEAGFDGLDLDKAGDYTPDEALRASIQTGCPVHSAINHKHWGKRFTSPKAEERQDAADNLKHTLRVSYGAGGSGVLLVIGSINDGELEEIGALARKEISALLPLAASLGQSILFENVWNGMYYKDDGTRDQSAEAWAAYIDSFNSRWIGSYFDIGNHVRYGNPADWIRTLGHRIGKCDIKGYSNTRADEKNDKGKGFCEISDSDIDFADVRKALDEINYHGWFAAEVGGGDVKRLIDVRQQMEKALLG